MSSACSHSIPRLLTPASCHTTGTAKGFVVLAAGEAVSEDELLEFCRARLAAYEVPSSVMFIDRLPRSSVGKLLRHELVSSPYPIPRQSWHEGPLVDLTLSVNSETLSHAVCGGAKLTSHAELKTQDHFQPGLSGSSLNRAARLMGVTHGGQVVCSQATTDLARDVLADGVDFVDLGEHRLRDLSRAEHVFQVCAPGLAGEIARALASLDAFPGNLPLQNAANVLPRFHEGAWLIELAAVRDPDDVVDAVAGCSGSRRERARRCTGVGAASTRGNGVGGHPWRWADDVGE